MESTTLAHVLADPTSAEPAILDEALAVAVSHRSVADQVERLAQTLFGAGLNAGDAVVLVLPNGLELLILCLAVVRAGLIAVPLDPADKARELTSLFAGVGARAVVGEIGDATLAAVAAESRVLMWTSSTDRSGEVRLVGLEATRRGLPGEPSPDDVALYLHTSGTEGAPKIVPLTHANVLHSVRHIVAHYALTAADRSLVVLPLFHGHGLIGAALSSLASGGGVILPARFSASRFWASFGEHRATWYTAVPTIHQILLARADTDGAPHSGARFIRSCSSALAPSILAGLERRFNAPVTEAYGMTEASHQVASNPLPPRVRKPGSVGVGTGVELAVLDASGRQLPAHSAGEVVVRGASVMHGYRNNAAATATAFVNGWLRTGDVGVLDESGYLTLTGRMKEMINRGGEKISPAEIDAVLLAHPAVADAAAFGVPDAKYGEAVEAAVVLKGSVDPEQLRSFCGERLADFKVPRIIHVVPLLPRNALGKIQRHALAVSFST
ncbi:MAG: AMP-binding protein [Gammaproteobacteria bacterium]